MARMATSKQRIGKDRLFTAAQPSCDGAFQPFPSCELPFVIGLRHFQRSFKTGTSLLLVSCRHLRLTDERLYHDAGMGRKVRRKIVQDIADIFEVSDRIADADRRTALRRKA